jgi:hypothetical protein
MRKFNFDTNIIEVIKGFYSEATNPVLKKNEACNSFQSHCKVSHKGVSISSASLYTYIYIYIVNIMQETLNNFQTAVAIVGDQYAA